MPRTDLRLVETGPLRHLVSLPHEAGAGPPPLLCFLHGYDEAAPVAIERALARHGPLSPRSAPLARARFVIVAPQLPRAGDLWHRHAADVREIVRRVQHDAGADPARTYLTGFSFGGNGVLDLALDDATPWAALWPVDPTRPPERDPGLPVWLSIGAAARGRAAGFVDALELHPAGSRDADAATLVADDRLHLDEGLDHVGSATSAYADERIYHWLLARRRDD